MPVAPLTPWTTEIGLRMRRYFPLKLVGVTLFTWVFFIAYFHLLRFPARPAVTMPLTALDHLIPFEPLALFPYLSLWLYVGVGPGLQLRMAELLVYALWAAGLCVAGLSCFYLWPTQVPPLAIDVSGMAGFAMLKGVDAAGNACPSMHVAIAMFTALRLEEVLARARVPAWLRLGNAAWFIAIAFSTLAIKQHVVLDVVAGALLGMAFAFASMRWRPDAAAPYRADIIVAPRPVAETRAGVRPSDIAP